MRFTPATRTAAAVLSVLTALFAPTTAHAATPQKATAPVDTVTLPAREGLASLPVRSENRFGYERYQQAADRGSTWMFQQIFRRLWAYGLDPIRTPTPSWQP